METAQIRFLRAVAKCRTMARTRNEDIKEEMGITQPTDTIIINHHLKWCEDLERIPENRILKLLYQYRPKSRAELSC
jgi:hypothetical protein